MTATRTCPRCGQELPETRQHFYRRSRGGWESWCRPCCLANNRTRNGGTTQVRVPTVVAERLAAECERQQTTRAQALTAILTAALDSQCVRPGCFRQQARDGLCRRELTEMRRDLEVRRAAAA